MRSPSHRLVLSCSLLSLTACPDEAGTAASSTETDTDTTGTTGTLTTPSSTTTGLGTTSVDTTTGPTTDTDTGPNLPPPVPVLLTPPDGQEDVPTDVELCWEPVEDPNGDDVRYRVYVDDIELQEGKLGELPGHPGPCLGPLHFNEAQTFSWTVEAIEADDPEQSSGKATAFSFTTWQVTPGTVVFEDDFDDDKGWTVDGDANSGAWVRGDPIRTEDGPELAQPGECSGGQSCYFTGHNPQGVVDDADVAGGSTILLSPEFDPSAYAALSVQLTRFFYKGDPTADASLTIELLTPDAAAPDGHQATVLEQLQTAQDVDGSNLWTPMEYAGCDVPLVAGSRLRITATDLGTDITEAGIDNVKVLGYDNDAICNAGGLGSMCDPDQASSCADEYLCCPQGTLHRGVYRCAEPVAGLDYENPPGEGEPFNGALGCDGPDLFVEEQGMTMCRDEILVENNPNNAHYCALLEGCVGGTGLRTIVRFDTITPNNGSKDLTMGVPANHPDLFHFSACHSHYHFDDYAVYGLYDGGSQVAAGHKQAFCLLDWNSWAWPDQYTGNFTCSNQGISTGWQDVYGGYLDCQWIDVTGVPDGDYTLRISVNVPGNESALPTLVERDFTNNVLEVPMDLANLPPCN